MPSYIAALIVGSLFVVWFFVVLPASIGNKAAAADAATGDIILAVSVQVDKAVSSLDRGCSEQLAETARQACNLDAPKPDVATNTTDATFKVSLVEGVESPIERDEGYKFRTGCHSQRYSGCVDDFGSVENPKFKILLQAHRVDHGIDILWRQVDSADGHAGGLLHIEVSVPRSLSIHDLDGHLVNLQIALP